MEEKKAGLFSRIFVGNKKEDGSVIELDHDSIPTTAEFLPHTIIAFTPEQEQKYSLHEKEEFQKQLLNLPPLRLGEINFVPFEAGLFRGGYFVRVFIRHGRDLLEEFTLEEVPLCLIDADGDKVAGGVFSIKKFGTLRFGESRVWTFTWSPQQVVKQGADLSSFTLSFE